MLHEPPLTSIESLKVATQYYLMQLLIYAETIPDAEPATIAGLGGMQYGLMGRRQETMRQIRALHQQLEPAEEDDTNDPKALEIGAITIEEDRKDKSEQANHPTGASEELFFTDLAHEEIRICKEPEVQDYWEADLMTESLSGLQTGKADQAKVICYHCSGKGHMKANCPDRKHSNK